MRELEYPFDPALLLKKKKQLRRALLSDGEKRLKKRIAILGSSTTHDLRLVLELFLLNHGIEPEFYECEYNRYYEDVMFDAPELKAFAPELVYLHTSFRSIPENLLPRVSDTEEEIAEKQEAVLLKYRPVWDKLQAAYGCEVVQDNFERPYYRLLGNLDSVDVHGRTHFVLELNRSFVAYARAHESFHINDADWLSSQYGLSRWSDPVYWNMYKYCPAVPAIPYLAQSAAAIIKSVYGKNKKALALDLDNTLWGGVVGDDGPENLEIGKENGTAEMFAEFQSYLKAQQEIGVLLTVDSKNERENALAGLSRADSVLKPEDFLVIRANWEPKDQNLREIARELNIGEDAVVFVDDNPAERHIVREQLPAVSVPEMTEGQAAQPERYLSVLDRSYFFEPVRVSADDKKRVGMYRENLQRKAQEAAFTDYHAYLLSLSMQAEIGPFAPEYMSRIAQLTNKSNQFNLTTRRFSQAEIEAIAKSGEWITLYGKLADRFGDNGVVSVVAGRIKGGRSLHLELWLMSCRVLKRGMEQAMLDTLAEVCCRAGISELIGYYYPTAKNKMVHDFYGDMGFEFLSEDTDGNRTYRLSLLGYEKKNDVIEVKYEQRSGI